MVDVAHVNESQGVQQRLLNRTDPKPERTQRPQGIANGCCGVGKCCFSIADSFLQHSLGWRPGLGYDEVTITILGCSLLGEQQLPERALRAGHDLGGRAVFHDPAVFQDRDVIGVMEFGKS